MSVRQWYGPYWSLPMVTGTAVTTGFNVLDGQEAESSEYVYAASALILSAPEDNSGDAFLVQRSAAGTYDSSIDGTVLCTIPKGQVTIFPPFPGGDKIDLRAVGIAAASGDIVYPTAKMN